MEGKSINSSPEEVFISQRENMLAFLLPGKNLWPLNLGKNYFLLKIGLGKNYSFLGSIYTPVHYIALTDCSGANAMPLWVIYYPHTILVKCFEY